MLRLKTKEDVHRLYASIKRDCDALDPFCRERHEAIKDFCGPHYGTNKQTLKVICNQMHQTAEICTVALSSNRPRVRVSTEYPQLWPMAYRYQAGLNNLLKAIAFESTSQMIVLDAFFSVGIAKVHLEDAGRLELEENVWYDPGRPFVSRISLDDFFCDMAARSWNDCRYIGNFYRADFDKALEDPMYDTSIIRKAGASNYRDGRYKAQSIGAPSVLENDQYERGIDLFDVWIPELGEFCTFIRHFESEPIARRPWHVSGSPYKRLTSSDVPDNIMPSSPAENLKELFDLNNGLYRKSAMQAQRQKTNPTFSGGAGEDAKTLKAAKDGEWVKVRDPQGINVISQGGVDPKNVAFHLKVQADANRMAGNLDAMAGLQASAPTLGQEEILQQVIGRLEAKRVSRVHSFAAEVCTALAHLMWDDPLLEIPNQLRLGRIANIQVDTGWTPRNRQGERWMFNFEVEPDSMIYVSGDAKVGRLMQSIEVLMKLYPAVEARGGQLDTQEICKLLAEYQHIPELENVFRFPTGGSIPRPGPGEEEGAGAANQTSTRTYIRRNVAGGDSVQGGPDEMMQALAAAGAETGEA